ncbi:MAG: NADAR family protein [Thaumarchaeota archaeon]|nr:NADAR family protein [Nitrososphaerota archaeon]
MADILQKYNRYTFFWSGPFSNWKSASFVLDGQQYGCVEQYMMQKKALMFDDIEIANEIMKTTNPREQKAWGRRVRNFNMNMWAVVARDVVFRGCLAKFTQNVDMYHELMATSGTLLVEASPLDKVWGIGLDEKTAAVTPIDQWKGANWLGQCLTEVRETFESQLTDEKVLKHLDPKGLQG